MARKPLLSHFSSTLIKFQQRTDTCAFNFSSVTGEQLNYYDIRIYGRKYYCREQYNFSGDLYCLSVTSLFQVFNA